MESALMMMVRVDPRVEPAPAANEPGIHVHDGLEWHLSNGDGSTHREAAERLRQEIDDERREAEAEAAQTPTNARGGQFPAGFDVPEAGSTAGTDGAPTLKYLVVWGGPHEEVHGIFNTVTELQPLIGVPGAQAYGAAHGVTTKELAEAKLRALQNARAAQQ